MPARWIAIVFPLLVASVFPAQPPTPLAWVYRDGTNGTENPRRLAVDTKGNVIVVGSFLGNGRFGTNAFTGPSKHSGYLAKYTQTGSNVWARALLSSGVDDNFVQGIAVDPAGSVYVCGEFTDMVDFGGVSRTSAGTNDFFTAKYDLSGNLMWLFTGGGVGRDQAFAIDLDAATNVYVTGMFRGTSTYGTNVVSANGTPTDLSLLKLNSDGQLLWVRRAGGTGADEPRGLAVDPAGNSYIAGVFGATGVYGSSNLVSAGALDAIVWKYDTSGNLIWAFAGGGTNTDEAKSVAVDPDGNVYINGYFNGTAQFGTNGLTSEGGEDVFTAMLDRDGHLLWIRTGGGAGDDSGRGIAIDLKRNVYTTGWVRLDAAFDGVSMTNLTSATATDIPLLKYDCAGNLLWAQRFGGDGADPGWDLFADALGNIYLTAQISRTGNFGISNLTSAGATDQFIGKLPTETPPPLAVTQAATNLLLSWSVLASEFRLESATNLGTPTLWTNVGAPVASGASNVITVPANGSPRFFRLRWP